MSRASTVIASPATATPGAARGGVPSAASPLQPAAARDSVTAPAASTRRRVASRVIVHLPPPRPPAVPRPRQGTADAAERRAYHHATPEGAPRPVSHRGPPGRPPRPRPL